MGKQGFRMEYSTTETASNSGDVLVASFVVNLVDLTGGISTKVTIKFTTKVGSFSCCGYSLGILRRKLCRKPCRYGW